MASGVLGCRTIAAEPVEETFNKLLKNKLFNSSKMLVSLNNGFVNFNNTVFEGKVGTLILINSSIENF